MAPSRQGMVANVKQEIIKAALRLFEERGYPLVSVREIVEAAGVTKGGFYYYFTSKEELLYLIHEEFITYELMRARSVVDAGGSNEEKLRRIISDLVESIDRYKSHVTVFFQERRHLSPANFERIKTKRDEYEGIITGLIHEGMPQAEFRDDLDARIVAFGIFGMCDWMYQWFRRGGRYTSREIAEMFAELIFGGLRAPSKGSADAKPLR